MHMRVYSCPAQRQVLRADKRGVVEIQSKGCLIGQRMVRGYIDAGRFPLCVGSRIPLLTTALVGDNGSLIIFQFMVQLHVEQRIVITLHQDD